MAEPFFDEELPENPQENDDPAERVEVTSVSACEDDNDDVS